jgi:hypothetical protein
MFLEGFVRFPLAKSLSPQNVHLCMITPLRHLWPALFVFVIGAGESARADPAAELASFSAFKEVNIEKLAGGAAMVARGTAMNFPRGLAVESCYVVRKPMAKTAELHLQWSPLKHPELKVYLHTDFTGRPTLAEFQRITSAPSNSAVKAFVAATQKLSSGGGDLQLSAAEAKAFGSEGVSGPSGAAIPAPVAGFWSNVLFQRAQAFLSGGLGKLPPYETNGESVRPIDEVARLLKEAPRLRGHFSALIDATPFAGGRGSLTPAPYWEMFDVEGVAAVNLGVLYYRSGADTWQAVDAAYYASGGYYALLSFFQMWPVKAGGQDATLVWRGDLLSSAHLATLHGVERMGSSTAMMRETKRMIDDYLKDAAKAP